MSHHAEPVRGEFDVRMTAAEAVADVATVGDVAVFFSEHFERFRQPICELKQRGIATLYAIDGILEWRNAWENRPDEPACPWTMRPILSHKAACIGQHQARVLRDWGNGDKIEVVGLPRLDRLCSQRREQSTCGLSGGNESSIESSRGEITLLVMTAKFPGFTPEQTAITTQSLIDVARWIEDNSAIGSRPLKVTWRLTRGLDEELGLPNSVTDLTGKELVQQLQTVDAVITTASTAMLESMLLDRPTVLLDYHASPSYVPAAWTIRHAGDIDLIVRSALSPDAKRMSLQRSILHDELECQSPALPRLSKLIHAMHERSLECAAIGKPLEFAGSILPTEKTAASPLEIATVFPQHFDGMPGEVEELRAELAHSRREILLLQRQIDQLGKQLAQANEFYRQIQRHPVAGPVMRIRQRMVDAMKRWSKKPSSGQEVNGNP